MKPSHAAPRLIRLLRPPSSKRTRVVEPFGLLEGLGRTLGALRTAIGMGALVTPSLPAAPWVGVYEAKRASVRLFGRTLGGRDLALGLGALLAHRRRARSELADLILLGALADACDAFATLAVYNDLPRRTRPLVLLMTVGAAVGGGAIGLGIRRRA